ncbi:MAG: Asp23/Gls24 family envelope stress response protein [Anaerolineaceae bacterium]
MNEDRNSLGNIYISHQAIATIASHAAMLSYGVVGLAAKNLVDGLAHVLVKDPSQGIDINYEDDQIRIDLYIIVEYGTRIKEVSASVADSVRYHVQRTIGLPVREVNVHIRGLRISNPD